MSSSPLANFGKVSVRQCHKPNIKIPRSALCKIDTPYLRLASPKSPQRENTHPSQLNCDKVYDSFQKHQEKVGTPEISGQLSSKRNRIDRTEKKGMGHNESFTQLSEANRHVRKAIVLSKRNLHSGVEQKNRQSQEFALASASFGRQFPINTIQKISKIWFQLKECNKVELTLQSQDCVIISHLDECNLVRIFGKSYNNFKLSNGGKIIGRNSNAQHIRWFRKTARKPFSFSCQQHKFVNYLYCQPQNKSIEDRGERNIVLRNVGTMLVFADGQD